MDRDERIAAAFEKLFRTYQQSAQGDPETVLRERLERAQVYFEAVSQYDLIDIEAAVASFISGSAPGHNPSYIPPAPVVASEVRRQMNLRLESERRERNFRPALPAPDIERSLESQARVRALMEKAVANLTVKSLDEDPTERHRRLQARTNERFDAERGFTVGDPEDSADAA